MAGVRLSQMKLPVSGLLLESLACAVSWTVAVSAVSVSGFGEIVVEATPPGTFAETVRGEPARPVAVAVMVCAPVTAPSVQAVLARPLASELPDVGRTEPPPVATAKVTVLPLTPMPSESATFTTIGFGSWAPGVAVWLPPETSVSVAAGPEADATVIATPPDAYPVADAVTPTRPGATP